MKYIRNLAKSRATLCQFRDSGIRTGIVPLEVWKLVVKRVNDGWCATYLRSMPLEFKAKVIPLETSSLTFISIPVMNCRFILQPKC